MQSLFSLGTTKKVSMIDKKCLDSSVSVFQEERLPIVGVSGTDINQPRKPEAPAVADALKAAPGQDFQQYCPISAQKARSKAHS
jgi:hypothetical protein